MQISGRNSIPFSVPPLAVDKSGSSISDGVFELMRQRIITGELRPNQRLIESEIAKEMMISRTPVREALKHLEVLGYVNTQSNGGLVVTEHTAQHIRKLLEIREALECMAMRLSCQHLTEEEIRKAEDYYIRNSEAIRNGDIETYIETNRAFHEELCSACENELLLSLVRTFRYQYYEFPLVRLFTRRESYAQITEHRRILEAVRERNAPKAEKALKRHLKFSLKIALQRL